MSQIFRVQRSILIWHLCLALAGLAFVLVMAAYVVTSISENQVSGALGILFLLIAGCVCVAVTRFNLLCLFNSSMCDLLIDDTGFQVNAIVRGRREGIKKFAWRDISLFHVIKPEMGPNKGREAVEFNVASEQEDYEMPYNYGRSAQQLCDELNSARNINIS